MTVAAVILSATPEGALREIDGRPLVRRLVEAAWSGGAVPIVVVCADPDGAVAEALAGAKVTLAAPAPEAGGAVAQIVRGIDVARSSVVETDAAIIWPARMAWVDPETITSLIEAHGTDPEPLLRPSYDGDPGWPALLPVGQFEALRGLGHERMPDELLDDLAASGAPTRTLEVGDPGTVNDVATDRADLPPYAGPPQPASGHTYEWGAAAAEEADDAPLPGPTIAPWGPGPDD
ncbi:MAG: nucleotidyltransferase family protein [Candidatus Limnocylindrales bacterium]